MRDFDPTAGEFAGHDAIHITGRHYDVATIVGGGLSLLGGMEGADAAEDAANIQAQTTREANKIAERQFDTVRSDLAPFRGLGTGAVNALAQGLGITMPTFQASAADREAIRQRLLPQFTRGGAPSAPAGLEGLPPQLQAIIAGQQGGFTSQGGVQQDFIPGAQGSAQTVDEAALNAAIEREMQAMQMASTPQGGGPGFGSLMQDFTGADLENEPGFQFEMDQGMKALNNRLAAGGSFFSGAALKGGQRFAQGLASTRYGDAFNRDAANKARKFNFLTGAVGIGQNAAAQTGNAGQNMVNTVGANTTALGNAQGAARIAGSNALAGGINNAVGAYQQNELLRRITGGNTGFGTSGLNNHFFGFGTGGD